MTYKKLLKEIDEHTKGAEGATLIDGLILKYGKWETVDALDYVASFFKSNTFNRMEYWYTYTDEAHHIKYEITCHIMHVLKRLYPETAKKCDYYINCHGSGFTPMAD